MEDLVVVGIVLLLGLLGQTPAADPGLIPVPAHLQGLPAPWNTKKNVPRKENGNELFLYKMLL